MKPSVTCLNRYLSSNGKIFISGADKQCGKASSQKGILQTQNRCLFLTFWANSPTEWGISRLWWDRRSSTRNSTSPRSRLCLKQPFYTRWRRRGETEFWWQGISLSLPCSFLSFLLPLTVSSLHSGFGVTEVPRSENGEKDTRIGILFRPWKKEL